MTQHGRGPSPTRRTPSNHHQPGVQAHTTQQRSGQQISQQQSASLPLQSTAHINAMATYDPRPPHHAGPHGMHRPASPLPPMGPNTTGGMEPYTGRALPPIQLPPMRSSPPVAHPPPRRDPNHTMAVTSLLSSNPDSPPRSQRASLPAKAPAPQSQRQPPAQAPSHHSMDASNSSPDYGYGSIAWRPSAPAHYMDQPPQQRRGPPPQAVPAPFASQPFQFPPRPSHPASEPDLAHHSPATTYRHSPGYYAASSEPSPTTAFATPFPEPAQAPTGKAPALDYNLTIRQQPAAARACGYGERDRRVIDPPPILELKTTDKATGSPELDSGGMLALHCTLMNKDGEEDDFEAGQSSSEGPASRRLMGSLVAAPYQAKDENGTAGTFFVFPDLSCRNPGRYRLKFTLIRIDPTCMLPGTKHPTVAHIVTDAFSVYTAKDFPGMRASSGLLKALRRQGLNVGVKKGSDARKGKGKAKKGGKGGGRGGGGGSSSDEEDDDSDGSEHGDRKAPSVASGAGTDTSAEHTSPQAARNSAKGKRRRIEGQ